MKQVFSSHVNAVDYQDGNLVVHYKTGKTVSSAGVPEDIASQVMNAGSVGTALNTLIKGVYPHSYRE